jgi:cytosine/adenosine deaminase-related metal-dependent hydrolase
LIDKGLIKAIGFIGDTTLAEYKDLVVIDAGGAWITPGYVVPDLFILSSLLKPLLASLIFTLIWALTALPVSTGLQIQIH